MNHNDVPTRREFMIRAGGAALTGLTGLAAFSSGVPFAWADSETGVTPPVRVGSGDFTYECLHGWLTPPPELKWGDTHGVAQDSKGRLYIAHTVHPTSTSKDAIAVFDKKGKFLSSWGARFAGGAHGLDLRREPDGKEYLYHCDTRNKLVVKTTLDGTVVWEKGVPVEANVYADGKPFTPTNVAFAPDGGFYVADGYGSSYIHRYDAKANYVSTFGGKGADPGQVNCPHGLYLDQRGKRKEPFLVVADRSNHRLQYFTPEGRHVRFDREGMRQPCHFHTRGDLLLVPDLDSIVTILDKDNKVVAALGDGSVDGKSSGLRGVPREQFIPGKFVKPHGAKFLQNGDILVTEWVPIGRITLLRKVKG